LCKNVKLTTEVIGGKPYEEILRTVDTKGIDLVVMGSTGRHGLNRVLLGSTTDRVLRSAKVPVVVVP
jgi:nucleotide-binding universal stress UspA family protein